MQNGGYCPRHRRKYPVVGRVQEGIAAASTREGPMPSTQQGSNLSVGHAAYHQAGNAVAQHHLKHVVIAIVQALVDKPDEVQINEVIGEHAHVLELLVAKEDVGKVIGRRGAHATAIRTLMAAASGKESKRYILEIIEP